MAKTVVRQLTDKELESIVGKVAAESSDVFKGLGKDLSSGVEGLKGLITKSLGDLTKVQMTKAQLETSIKQLLSGLNAQVEAVVKRHTTALSGAVTQVKTAVQSGLTDTQKKIGDKVLSSDEFRKASEKMLGQLSAAVGSHVEAVFKNLQSQLDKTAKGLQAQFDKMGKDAAAHHTQLKKDMANKKELEAGFLKYEKELFRAMENSVSIMNGKLEELGTRLGGGLEAIGDKLNKEMVTIPQMDAKLEDQKADISIMLEANKGKLRSEFMTVLEANNEQLRSEIKVLLEANNKKMVREIAEKLVPALDGAINDRVIDQIKATLSKATLKLD